MLLLGLPLAGAAVAAPSASRGDPSATSGWELRVPNIGVAAPVIELGGSRYGELAVPALSQAQEVGWYRFGVVPGQVGNAVFFGHVDTYLGTAVFYNLYQLRPGNMIYVDLSPGHTVAYTVKWVKEVSKADFPSHTVFGPTSHHKLWLITCGGQFNYATRHYESNIIVSAGIAR
jgi:LPXTG-site transpeptidase (sortase) family protein